MNNGSASQANKLRPASAKTGLDHMNGGQYGIPMQQQQWNPQQQQIDPNLPTQQYSYQQIPLNQG